MISTEARLAFLRRIHLFQDLGEEDLNAIAGALQEETRREGDRLYVRGDEADKFYIIQRGAVRISVPSRGGERELAPLTDGDYFGEDALRSSGTRLTNADATEALTLLSLPRADLLEAAGRLPKLKRAFQVVLASRRLLNTLRFDWRGPNEAIHFIARKHEVVLYQSLSGPIIALVAPILLLAHFMLSRSFFAILGAGVLFVAILGWAIWNWIDWGNDFYIVTSQRVVWLEKVIGLYDSRQEAPLATVLSVGVETDMMGRVLDYGDVVVRTYVGKIAFRSVAHPFEAARLVEEHWGRSKRSASRTEREAMRNVLRRKMGQPEIPTEAREQPAPEETSVTPSIYRRSILRFIGEKWFNLRVEQGGSIIYHKHWFVLLAQTWQPTVVGLLLLGGMIARLVRLAQTVGIKLYDSARTPALDTMMLVLPTLLIPVIIWWIYQYLDWRNDIYVVTSDQILDIDKKPFGTETRRSAPLENILSTEAERVGLPGYLMNYGTVYITIGGASLDFEGVQDPSAVQADIDRRREARVAQQHEMEAVAERERMSDWLIAYHENQQDAPPPPGPAGKTVKRG
ncbi:MAG TPA: cyclic nucleotide-binding domain-containing protein [Anaerolineales bacterium]|nr:cyclic nucleotide-binding domain-containing protein [Anaerolineales bacterium]